MSHRILSATDQQQNWLCMIIGAIFVIACLFQGTMSRRNVATNSTRRHDRQTEGGKEKQNCKEIISIHYLYVCQECCRTRSSCRPIDLQFIVTSVAAAPTRSSATAERARVVCRFYRATACNATHGIAVAILSGRLSVCSSVRLTRVL